MSPGEGGLSDLGQGCARCPRDAPAPDRRRPRSAAGACGGALVGRGRDDSVGGRVRGHDGPAAPTNPVSVKAGPAQRAAVPTPPPGRSRRRVARESRSAATRRAAAAAGVSRRTRRARSFLCPQTASRASRTRGHGVGACSHSLLSCMGSSSAARSRVVFLGRFNRASQTAVGLPSSPAAGLARAFGHLRRVVDPLDARWALGMSSELRSAGSPHHYAIIRILANAGAFARCNIRETRTRCPRGRSVSVSGRAHPA